ncbi:hypothetical protein L2E82_20359 [Cichorium intybus]|uniref:Uncharacterized protein n=1 Tax=Cichorium intybus TaxID=13427 RepID=A0ACB9DTE3_CICIN|nr:hypothetical protein L2E82_20359 [Cichorium intybus]
MQNSSLRAATTTYVATMPSVAKERHQIREHSYKELMLEFFSKATFDPTEEDMFVRTGLSFRLGGEPRQCSVVELGWRLGLYPHGDARTQEFREYMARCITSPPEELVNEEFWGEIASTAYLPETAIESAIRSPIHRLLHRLVATSINQRRGCEKVPATDLFYLWCLLTPGRHCNLPYSLAFFLARKATGARASSPLCGGHLITRLAHSYGITTLPAMRSMTPREPRAIGRQYLETMRVIRPAGPPGVFELAEPEQDEQAPEAAQAPPPPPRRRQRQRQRSPVHPQDPEPEINLGTIYQQMQSWHLESQTQYRQMQDWHLAHQVQQQWMADSMTDFFHHQGFQPQYPYPSTVPPVPDWYTGSHPTGDGAGPSGTHYDDEDDEKRSNMLAVSSATNPTAVLQIQICQNYEFSGAAGVRKTRGICVLTFMAYFQEQDPRTIKEQTRGSDALNRRKIKTEDQKSTAFAPRRIAWSRREDIGCDHTYFPVARLPTQRTSQTSGRPKATLDAPSRRDRPYGRDASTVLS